MKFFVVLLVVLVLVAVGESRRRVLSRKVLQTSCSKKCKGAYNTIAWNEDDTCECCPKTAIKCKTFKKCKRDAATGCVTCSCATTAKSKVTLRVAQGTTVKAGDLPYMVGLVQTGTKDIFCGGGLLSEQWVLTAAHCTEGMTADQLQLFVGGINAKSGPGEFINAKKIIIHPNYDSQIIINDLSLIQLSKPVKSDGKTISFLGLPADTPPVGSFAIVSGWGLQETKVQPEIIKKALIPVADRQKCIDMFDGYNNQIQFCGGNGSGKDACQGDSGGPIVIRDNSLVANVIGVTSYGTDTCGAKGSMGVYVRVPAFANWIRQQIGVPTTDDTSKQVTEEPTVDSSDSGDTSADTDE